MKTLSATVNKEKIKNFVIEWIELLSQEKYAEALDFILYDNTQEIDGEIWVWTPERLEAAIFTYGQPWYTKDDMKQLYGEDYPVNSKVTSVLNHPDKEHWLDEMESSIIFFDYGISPEMAQTWGISRLNYKNIIGEVFFDRVPMDGEPSDLTALFWIQKVSDKEITLVFRDLHMM